MLHIILHQPEIPDNTGNIGRTCVALGAKLWLVRPLGFRLDDRHLQRAGLDYWQHLEWEAAEDWDALLERLPDVRFWFFTKRAAKLYTEAAYTSGDALVFGCETHGLPDAMLAAWPERVVQIPMQTEHVRSLNLANSVAIALYEALRQVDARAT